jgi:hypothetical protein
LSSGQSHQLLSETVIFRGQSLVLDGAFIKRRGETSQMVTIHRRCIAIRTSRPAMLLFREAIISEERQRKRSARAAA